MGGTKLVSILHKGWVTYRPIEGLVAVRFEQPGATTVSVILIRLAGVPGRANEAVDR